MSVLVAFASAQGSTGGIASRIADRLRARGVAVQLAEFAGLPGLGGYDAAVLGSAIHGGQWLPEASRMVSRSIAEVGDKPVWLFSVSSIGETSSFFPRFVTSPLRRMRGETREIARIRSLVSVRDHRNFAGAIKKGDWSRVGDVFLRVLGGRFGDYRDWADIDAWADAIAAGLDAPAN